MSIKTKCNLRLALCILALFAMCIYAKYQKSKVKYVNIECPMCESVEVLDFGTNYNGEQKCHCADCGVNFTITENN